MMVKQRKAADLLKRQRAHAADQRNPLYFSKLRKLKWDSQWVDDVQPEKAPPTPKPKVYYNTIKDDEAAELKLRRDDEGWFTRSTKIQATVDAYIKSREVFLPANVMKNILEFCGPPLPANKVDRDTATRQRTHTRYFRDAQGRIKNFTCADKCARRGCARSCSSGPIGFQYCSSKCNPNACKCGVDLGNGHEYPTCWHCKVRDDNKARVKGYAFR